MRILCASVMAVCMAPAMADEMSASKGKVWMMPPALPDGQCLRELFTQPDQWKETRSKVGTLSYIDHYLDKQYTDAELGAWLPMIKQWGLRFALEVGAIKEWGTTGKVIFDAQLPRWERFRKLGANIDEMVMDEPLYCSRDILKKPLEYAVEETAQFVALVRAQYPNVRIGDVEPYPVIPLSEHIAWIDALQARLKQMNVRGLDFYRLDVNWVEFNVISKGNWREVKKLEEACRERNLPFSLIYWAADQPPLHQLGLADASTWYVSIMRQAYDYAMVGGAPDEYVIQSWIEAPPRAVPETDDWTFTRSVNDFCDRFVKPKK